MQGEKCWSLGREERKEKSVRGVKGIKFLMRWDLAGLGRHSENFYSERGSSLCCCVYEQTQKPEQNRRTASLVTGILLKSQLESLLDKCDT